MNDSNPSNHFLVVSVQVGRPRNMGDEGLDDPMNRPWTSGIFKAPVNGPVWLSETGLEGDGQADSRNHGGPEKAVLAYAAWHYPDWRVELAPRPISFGAFGENLTVAGWDESNVCIGDVFQIGEAVIQVSQPRQPCWKLARRWRLKDLPARVQKTGRTGWYYRVLTEGHVEPNQPMILQDRPEPHWTIALANDLKHRRCHDPDALAALADCPLLSANWRQSLRKLVSKATTNDQDRLVGPNG